MFETLQPGIVVKTLDGIGTIYRRDFTTVLVLIASSDRKSLNMNIYKFADVEPFYCSFKDKLCDNKLTTLTYPDCCSICKFNTIIEVEDLDS